MENKKKIALLIDYDNFNQEKYFPILLEELNEIGDVLIKYAYYSNLKDQTIQNKFIKYGIEPKSQIAYSSGKNAVDIKMTIEAMRLVSYDYIDAVCLASNDSDFTPLVFALKSYNKYVIGEDIGDEFYDILEAGPIPVDRSLTQDHGPENPSKTLLNPGTPPNRLLPWTGWAGD